MSTGRKIESRSSETGEGWISPPMPEIVLPGWRPRLLVHQALSIAVEFGKGCQAADCSSRTQPKRNLAAASKTSFGNLSSGREYTA